MNILFPYIVLMQKKKIAKICSIRAEVLKANSNMLEPKKVSLLRQLPSTDCSFKVKI